MKSLMDLFRAWPMCRLPLEKGGPSWREKRGLPSFFFSSLRGTGPCFFQRWSISGSRLGRPARMGKSVLGRLMVAL